MFVLDTNTLIYFFKGMGKISANLLATPPKMIGVPAVVLYELEYGIARSISPEKRMAQLNDLCAYTNILEFGEAEAKASASIRAELDALGKPIGPYDVLIAGTAVARGGILVTNNMKEFSRVPRLQTINWFV